MLDRVLRSAVPAQADFALVHVRSKQMLAGIAAAHRHRDEMRVLRTLLRVHRLRLSDPYSTVAQVVRTGRAQLRADICPDTQAPSRRPDRERPVAALHRQLAPRSALVVPIVVRGAVLGAISLCYAHSGRRYTPADVEPASRLALQAGSVLIMTAPANGSSRVHPATGHARPGTTIRRRLAPRD